MTLNEFENACGQWLRKRQQLRLGRLGGSQEGEGVQVESVHSDKTPSRSQQQGPYPTSYRHLATEHRQGLVNAAGRVRQLAQHSPSPASGSSPGMASSSGSAAAGIPDRCEGAPREHLLGPGPPRLVSRGAQEHRTCLHSASSPERTPGGIMSSCLYREPSLRIQRHDSEARGGGSSSRRSGVPSTPRASIREMQQQLQDMIEKVDMTLSGGSRERKGGSREHVSPPGRSLAGSPEGTPTSKTPAGSETPVKSSLKSTLRNLSLTDRSQRDLRNALGLVTP